MLVICVSLAFTYVAADWSIERCAYLTHFRQSWSSHFGMAESSEYGSAEDYPFDWSVMLKNWDTVVPAAYGIYVMLRSVRPGAIVPIAWLALSLVIFTTHKPWWSYYYIHIAFPLCWCAGVGVVDAVQHALTTRDSPPSVEPALHPVAAGQVCPEYCCDPATRGGWSAVLLVYGFYAVLWMSLRLWQQVEIVRNAPQIYNSAVLAHIQHFKYYTEWLYTDQPSYSFHSGIPIPPDLAVMPLKRFWSGQMTNARLAQELTACRPGLVLLSNNGWQVPFQSLLDQEYTVVYKDSRLSLYARPVVAKSSPP